MISYDNHIINAIKLNITNNKNILKYFDFTYTSQKHKIEKTNINHPIFATVS
jgi:hypothetical protein